MLYRDFRWSIPYASNFALISPHKPSSEHGRRLGMAKWRKQILPKHQLRSNSRPLYHLCHITMKYDGRAWFSHRKWLISIKFRLSMLMSGIKCLLPACKNAFLWAQEFLWAAYSTIRHSHDIAKCFIGADILYDIWFRLRGYIYLHAGMKVNVHIEATKWGHHSMLAIRRTWLFDNARRFTASLLLATAFGST